MSGPLRIVVNDTPLTDSPVAENGSIDEYSWKQLVALHVSLRRILQGEAVEIPILDNPGLIELTPTDDGVELRFDPMAAGWEIQSQTVDISTLAGAVLRATDWHKRELLELNADLAESSLITRLDHQRRQTNESLQRHEISVIDESE